MTVVSASRGPWEWLPASEDGPVIAIGVGLVLLVGFAMDVAGYRMVAGDVTRRGRVGILRLELAWSASRVREMVERWGPAGLAAARASIRWDFGWLVAYGLTLSVAAAAVADRSSGWRASVAIVVSWVALAAALCDAIEDALMLAALGDAERATVPSPSPAGDEAPRWATIAASMKFLLLGAAIPALGALALARWLSWTVPVAAAAGFAATASWLLRSGRSPLT